MPAVSVNVNDASQTETEAIPGDSGRLNLGDDWNVAQLRLCYRIQNYAQLIENFTNWYHLSFVLRKINVNFMLFGGQAIK